VKPAGAHLLLTTTATRMERAGGCVMGRMMFSVISQVWEELTSSSSALLLGAYTGPRVYVLMMCKLATIPASCLIAMCHVQLHVHLIQKAVAWALVSWSHCITTSSICVGAGEGPGLALPALPRTMSEGKMRPPFITLIILAPEDHEWQLNHLSVARMCAANCEQQHGGCGMQAQPCAAAC
jgi:hypothetical protein